MIITSQAPCRIGLLGGGTDVGEYASKYGGICINFAIDIRQQIQLSNDEWGYTGADNPKFFDTFFQEFSLVQNSSLGNTRVKHTFNGQTESGLGSSASLAVALVGAINKLKGTQRTKQQVAERAWDIEVNKLGLFGGKQDQYAAAYGGGNIFEFTGEGVEVTPLPKDSIDKLYPHMVLFYLGTNRKSPKIQEGFKNPTKEQIKALNEIKTIAYEAIKPLKGGDIEKIAHLLTKSWDMKKKSNQGVTNDFIDDIYELGIENGALGGKVLGAGGGGHMLFITKDPEKLIKELPIKHIPFKIDWEGLKVEVEE